MKIPRGTANSFKFARIFPPTSQPTAWNKLYAEFQSQTSVDLINQFLPNLEHGKSVSLYIPSSLFPRFTSVQEIAFSYRHGETKHKTKIKYGVSDFLLSVKPKQGNHPWCYVHLDLPPLELMPSLSSTNTPPLEGRPRLSSKRQLSPSSTEKDSERVNRPKLNSLPVPTSVHRETIQPQRQEANNVEHDAIVQTSLSISDGRNPGLAVEEPNSDYPTCSNVSLN